MTDCLGMTELRGTMHGDLLQIDFWPMSGTGNFEGSVSSRKIQVEKNCDPWGYGNDHTMRISLTR